MINKKDIAQGIVVYSDVINNHFELIETLEKDMLKERIYWHEAGVEGGKDKNVRDTDTISIPFINNTDMFFSSGDSFYKKFSTIFYEAFNPLEKNYFSQYGIDFPDHDSYQILRYGKGQKFTNHIDDHIKYHRRVSTAYYLNDNYEGGEINFPRFNISYKPKANELLIFPSTYVYNHSVSEVTDGTRYSVVSWIK
jgi:Rps23 Pro-64 3,4-dihydroxylase Tpa1-like proline 4-hydroxylase